MCNELENKVTNLQTVTRQLGNCLEDTLDNYRKYHGIDLTPVLAEPMDLLAVVIDYEKQIADIVSKMEDNSGKMEDE